MSNFAESGQNTKKEISKPPPPSPRHLTGIDINSKLYGKKETITRIFFPKEEAENNYRVLENITLTYCIFKWGDMCRKEIEPFA